MSSLPETLKEDFDQLARLEGRYWVTSFFTEELEDLEDLRPCDKCDVEKQVKHGAKTIEKIKPMITFSKVILLTVLNVCDQEMTYKVEVGSALYRKGVRWTEFMDSEIGKHDLNYMVLDYILTSP